MTATPASTKASPIACSISIRARSARRSARRDAVRARRGVDDPALAGLLKEAFADFPRPLEPIAADAIVGRVAELLSMRGDSRRGAAQSPTAHRAVERARDFLIAEAPRIVASQELEQRQRPRPLRAGPPFPRRLRHLAPSLPGRPPSRPRAEHDRRRRGAVRGRGGDRLRRPEPSHASLLGPLRPDAGPLGGACRGRSGPRRRAAPTTASRCAVPASVVAAIVRRTGSRHARIMNASRSQPSGVERWTGRTASADGWPGGRTAPSRCGARRSGRSRRRRSRSRRPRAPASSASTRPRLAPWPSCGLVPCAASPMNRIGPSFQLRQRDVAIGRAREVVGDDRVGEQGRRLRPQRHRRCDACRSRSSGASGARSTAGTLQ